MTVSPPTPTSIDSISLKHKRSLDETAMSSRAKRMNPETYKVIQIGALPNDLPLPPLPVIKNKDIEARVFSHSSLFTNARSGLKFGEEDHELLDNEKLEWIGDGILKMVCTTLLHRIWPNMREGPTTTIMGHLVSNSILAQVSNRYRLIDKLRLPSHSVMVVKAGEKSKANVFESYIAGLFQSFLQGAPSNGSQDMKPSTKTEGQAYDHVAEWLVPLFDPIARFIQQSLQDEQQRLSASRADQGEEQEIDLSQATGASAMLNQHCIGILGTGMPVYEHEQAEGLLWRTKCTAKLPGGEEVYAETVQSGKQPGKAVAAYKVLLQMGHHGQIGIYG